MITVQRITPAQYAEAAARLIEWARHDSTSALLARDFLEALVVRETPVDLGALLGRADMKNRAAILHVLDGWGAWGPCHALNAWRVQWWQKHEESGC